MSEEQKILLTAFPYIANRKSKEVHVSNCVWAGKIAYPNRWHCTPSVAAELISSRGYNGCFYCLPEYDTDKHVVTQESINKVFTHLATIACMHEEEEKKEEVKIVKWEYKIVEVWRNKTLKKIEIFENGQKVKEMTYNPGILNVDTAFPKELTSVLNGYGANDWELVLNDFDFASWSFKRPKQ